MAYTDNFPQRPIFSLDAANAGRLDPRMTFSRSDTPPTYAAPSAVHYWSNEKHLSSENLVLQSQSFDTTWTQYQLASSGGLTGSQSAPDGTSSAWLMTAGTLSPGAPFLNQTLSGIASSTEYTASVYLKAGSASHGYITLRGQFSHLAWAEIDFASPLSPTTGGANFTSISATSTAVGSTGWYRLTLTCTTSAVASPKAYVGPSDGTDPGLYGEAVWNCAGETIYVWGYQLEERGSATAYNATTTQIHREYAPTLKSVATAGQPRFEYDPASDGQSMGILIEGQFQQLAQYTEDLSNAYWTKANTTVESNAAVAPDGTLTADLVVETTATGVGHHVRTDNVTGISSSTTYTATVYAKAAGLGFCRLYTNIGAANTGAVFNLSDGTHNVTDGSGTFSSSSVGNGWYRLQMTFTTSNTNNGAVYFHTATDSSTVIYTGNGYGSVLIWGANLTQSSHAYSYLKAEGSATTKAAESLSMDLTQAGFNGGPVSIVGELAPIDASVTGSKRVFSLSNGSDSENIRVHLNNSRMYSVVRSGSSNTAVGYNSNTLNDGEAVKFGLAVDTDSLIASTSGFNSLGTTGATLPSQATRLGIAEGHSGGQTLNSHWKSVKVFSEPLSLTNLQALTS